MNSEDLPEFKEKGIYIYYNSKLTPIQDLNKQDYENFLDAMMKLNLAYSLAIASTPAKP